MFLLSAPLHPTLKDHIQNNPVIMGNCECCKLFVILFIIIILVSSVRAQDLNLFNCLENGNYTRNSRYRANLNTLLSSLSSNMSNNGFYNASVGQNQDTVNALAICRGDQTLDQCRTCIQTVSEALPQRCPNQKQAVMWYEVCTLRYSNESIYGTQTNNPTRILSNTASVPDPDELRAVRTRLFGALRNQAANGGTALKVGVGAANISADSPIYGLMQCTPDLSADQCDNCLERAAQAFRGCCDAAAGVRVLAPSCIIRYELYSFYNSTRLRELTLVPLSVLPSSPPLPSPPPGRNDSSISPGKKDDDSTIKVVIIIVVPVVVSLIFAAWAVIYVRKRLTKQRSYEITQTTDEISTAESIQYEFSKLRAATNDFAEANKLGQGGFGAVYRGKFSDGQEIAVKRLGRDSGQGNAEFKNEVLLLAKLQHRNLVRLLGFAMEGTERVLVYEFVQNASLDQFIFDPIKRSYLDWGKRFKIIGGIARGLMYLHEDSRLKIIHRDMKASNVLLDGDMNPKIADFGMARLFRQDETQGNTSKIVGTYGYMSPEYAMHGQFSDKSDVFSFGALVLEIISGKRNNYIQNEESSEDLLIRTWKNWREGTPENVIDQVLLENGRGSMREMMRCIHIGLLCVQDNAANRPTMTNVILMLSSGTMTLAVPLEPAFFMPSRLGPDTKGSNNSSDASNAKAGISQGSSRNDMSVSELDPR